MKYCEDCGFCCEDLARFCDICGFAFTNMIAQADDTEERSKTEKAEEVKEPEKTEIAEEVKEPEKIEIAVETVKPDDTDELAEVEEGKEAEKDTKEYYKEQMLQNKKMIDELKEQQHQMQLQMKTMQQQQWNQTQQQQRQQKMINHYNNQISQQRMLVQAQNKGVAIRNIWSMVAAIVCLLPFFINSFIKFNYKYYAVRCGFVEYCKEVTYGSVDTLSEWITSMLPIFVLVLIVVLIIGAYKPINKVRGWVVIINIVAIIVAFFYIKSEEGSSTTFGISFWLLALGIFMAAYSCCTGDYKVDTYTGEPSYEEIQGSAYSLSMLAADSSMELKQEWRCPKCDAKNNIDYKYCRICSTARR